MIQFTFSVCTPYEQQWNQADKHARSNLFKNKDMFPNCSQDVSTTYKEVTLLSIFRGWVKPCEGDHRKHCLGQADVR